MQNAVAASEHQIIVSRYFSAVYRWMAGALALSALVAWKAANSPFFIDLLTKKQGIFWIIVIAQFGLVIALAAWVQKMSVRAAIISFLSYAILTGLTLSTIFLVYTTASIAKTFVVTAGMFGAMSLYGYTTKKDLSGWGSFLFMSLIGIIIASIVNIFLHSHMIEWITTYAGIIIFAGLAAYDNQRLKAYAQIDPSGSETAQKMAIYGALVLYLDFINLFLYLLRVLGNRD